MDKYFLKGSIFVIKCTLSLPNGNIKQSQKPYFELQFSSETPPLSD